MTRPEFEALYLSMYEQLLGMARKRAGDIGEDAVQQVYVLAIEHKTYESVTRGRIRSRQWLSWKVKQQVAEAKKEEAKQQGGAG